MNERGRKTLLALLVISLLSVIPESRANPKSTLTVFAASSLTDSLTNLGKTFEKSHPGVTVIFSFLASSTLATQINAGAPADVFVSAADRDMQMVSTKAPIYREFLLNRMVLAVPIKSPFRISRIKDLNKSGLKWIQCAHEIPCGIAADAALASDNTVTSKPVSLEPKASGVIAKLIQGEVDAAIVYHTDFVKNQKVLKEISFSDRLTSSTRYSIAIISDGRQKTAAQIFMDFLESTKALSYFRRCGFGVIS